MKQNIAVIYGGDSSEYEVSVNSGKNVISQIDTDLYNVFGILQRGNNWNYIANDGTKYPVDLSNFTLFYKEQKIQFNCAFIIVHGTPGEDGKMQAYFELMKIPYTTCDVAVSAITFNKFICKTFLKDFGIITAKSIRISQKEKYNISEIISYLGLPCFIKPNNGGSSCGTSKVKVAEEMEPAIRKAFNEDHEIIIEEFIDGVEVTNGLIITSNNEIQLPVTEVISTNEFFDYEAKYVKGKANEITPARISEEQTKQCVELTLKISRALGCNGIIRVDYILRNNQFYFLEVNTVPGMTATSFIPQQVDYYGMNLKSIFTLLIQDAIQQNNI